MKSKIGSLTFNHLPWRRKIEVTSVLISRGETLLHCQRCAFTEITFLSSVKKCESNLELIERVGCYLRPGKSGRRNEWRSLVTRICHRRSATAGLLVPTAAPWRRLRQDPAPFSDCSATCLLAQRGYPKRLSRGKNYTEKHTRRLRKGPCNGFGAVRVVYSVFNWKLLPSR